MRVVYDRHKKMLDLDGIPYIGAPQALKYNLNPAKQVLPEWNSSGNYAISMIPIWPERQVAPGKPESKPQYQNLIDFPDRIWHKVILI